MTKTKIKTNKTLYETLLGYIPLTRNWCLVSGKMKKT